MAIGTGMPACAGRNPQVVVQPVLLVAEAVVPTILGLLVFIEAKKFDRAERLYALLGIVGVILLAVGYR